MDKRARGRWQDGANLFLGFWLMAAPALGLAPSGTGLVAWNSYIVGAGIVVFASWALAEPGRWEEWLNLILGLWLIAAPFVLGFTGHAGATWNNILVGIAAGSDAAWAMAKPPLHGRIA